MSEPKLFPPCPFYRVYEQGRIESRLRRGRRGPTDRWVLIRGTQTPTGHWLFTPRIDGKPTPFLVHRAVLETFVGPCPPGMVCRHLDGNPSHNHVRNLAWGTSQENVLDKIRHGTMPRDEGHGSSSVTDAVRDAITRDRHLGRMTVKALAAKYAVPLTTVKYVLYGRHIRRYETELYAMALARFG